MRLYRRSKDQDLTDTINLSQFDADQGRIALGLERLKDLEEELGADAKISYAEGLLRKDFLGQGLEAHRLFERSYTLDNRHAFAACNAAVTAPDEASFRHWASIASQLSPEDAPTFQKMIIDLDAGESYWMMLHGRGLTEYHQGDRGTAAATLELALSTGQVAPLETEIAARRVRAQCLRERDAIDAQLREKAVEAFPADERLALREAVAELDRALAVDEYDAELWNLKSAWLVLMGCFEDALGCADRSIELRPYSYSRPYHNKATALYHLKRYEEALDYARQAQTQASDSDSADEQASVENVVELCSSRPEKPTLEGMRQALSGIVQNAMVTTNIFAELLKGSAHDLTRAFQGRLVHQEGARSIDYVPAMAQLLAYMPAEAGFFVVHSLGIEHPHHRQPCLEAALYIAAHGESIMQRDAARLLLLTMFQEETASAIREAYRLGVLEPSAAADDEMSNLDTVVRAELNRINPALVELIAEQEPVTDSGIQRATSTILANLKGTPFINDSSNFARSHSGCSSMVLALMMTIALLLIVCVR